MRITKLLILLVSFPACMLLTTNSEAQFVAYESESVLENSTSFLGTNLNAGDQVFISFKYDVLSPRQSPPGVSPADYVVSDNSLVLRVGKFERVMDDYIIQIENDDISNPVDRMRVVSALDGGALLEFTMSDSTGNLFSDISLPTQVFTTSDFDEISGTVFADTLEVLFFGSGDLVSGTSFDLGDINDDGAVNLLDVSPFIETLSSSQFIPAADMNCDGAVNLLDVDPFITALAG